MIAPAAAFASFHRWNAVTSLGETAAETAILLRAGLNNISPSRFVDRTGARIAMCMVPALAPALAGVQRAARLADMALRGLDGGHPPRGRASLFLAVPERFATAELPPTLNEVGQLFVRLLPDSLPSWIAPTEVKLFPFGRAGGAVALREALALCDAGGMAVWGGVDTSYDWGVLEALENDDRLLTEANVDGVRPGEAAAMVLLGPADGSRGPHVLGVGTGREPHPIGSEEPTQSLGLGAALAAAVAPLRAAAARSNYWLLDNSHEAYATIELQNLIAKFGDVLGTKGQLSMPLQELGDAGAAAMPVMAALAAEAWRLGFAPDTTAIITGCSRTGARGAVVLGAPAGFSVLEAIR